MKIQVKDLKVGMTLTFVSHGDLKIVEITPRVDPEILWIEAVHHDGSKIGLSYRRTTFVRIVDDFQNEE